MNEMQAMNGIADIIKKECCIFIGAGIPKTIGFPLWHELAQELIDYVWSKRKVFVDEELTTVLTSRTVPRRRGSVAPVGFNNLLILFKI